MSSQKQFQKQNEHRWVEASQSVEQIREASLTREDARALPSLFRKVCQELGVAQERLYGSRLTNRLNHLVMDLFHHIHRAKTGVKPVEYLLRTVPGAFKHNLHFFWISVVMFWIPFAALAFSGVWGLEWIQSLLGAEGIYQIDAMYGKEGDALAHGREEYGSDFMMFCFYIKNNVGIDFKCYAGGIFFGLGTIFFTLFNGLYLGAVVGYVQAAGDPEKLWTFVAGHSAFELMGLHLSSMAGLRLGWGLISPGNQSRVSSLIRNGRESIVILGAAAILTFLAACIEGFWSAQPNPPMLKYSIGGVLWVVTLVYLFSGKKSWYERP